MLHSEKRLNRGDAQVNVPSGINIVGRSNGVGLDRDATLIADILAGVGSRPSFSNYRQRSWPRSLMPAREMFDVTIFLERVFPAWIKTSARSVLIPNQERYPHRQIRRLRRIDHVLAKTRHAQEVFDGLGCPVSYVGFTSLDRLSETESMDYGSVLHLAGASNLKGTETLLSVWRRHPEWPELVVIRHRHPPPEDLPGNVRLVGTYLDDPELRGFQNRCGLQVFPSLAEGWGHALVEGMSCRAMVITTDGPPMNELIEPDRGVCVPYAKATPRHLGTSFHVDEEALEAAIQSALDQPEHEKRALGLRAREWFLENDRRFRQALPEELNRVLSGS